MKPKKSKGYKRARSGLEKLKRYKIRGHNNKKKKTVPTKPEPLLTFENLMIMGFIIILIGVVFLTYVHLW